MQLIILPLTEKGVDKKKQRIKQAVELAKKISEDAQAFLLANLLVISDKFIDDVLSKDIRRWLKMTKVARLIADEAREERDREIVERMIVKGVDNDKIAEYTGINIDDVEVIRRETIKQMKIKV